MKSRALVNPIRISDSPLLCRSLLKRKKMLTPFPFAPIPEKIRSSVFKSPTFMNTGCPDTNCRHRSDGPGSNLTPHSP